MSAPRLVGEEEHYQYYVDNFSKAEVLTIHGVRVYFNTSRTSFNHAFYKTDRSTQKKTEFCPERGATLPDIKAALQSPLSIWKKGTPTKTRTGRREALCVCLPDFVIVLAPRRKKTTNTVVADFVTVYRATETSRRKRILSADDWSPDQVGTRA